MVKDEPALSLCTSFGKGSPQMNESFKNTVFEEDLRDLRSFFEIVKLPEDPIRLNKYSKITDVELLVKSHLNILKCHKGNLRFKPYLDRLMELKQFINQNLK